MSRYSIARLSEDTGLLQAIKASKIFPQLDAEPFRGDFGRSYYPVLLQDSCMDYSFAVLRDRQVVALMECDVTDRLLGRFGRSMCPLLSRGLAGNSRRETVKFLFAELDRLAVTHGITASRIEDPFPGAELSVIGDFCLARKGRLDVSIHAQIDLREDEAAIYRSIRKSYKSLINWGRRNLSLKLVNKEHPDWERFLQFKELHRAAAGRVTRADATWKYMYDTVTEGMGEVVLAYLDSGELVSAIMSLNGESVAEYSSSASDRSRFDKPLAHWPLYHAILRAKERGMAYFYLGEIPQSGAATDKEYSIGQFKKGFTSLLYPVMTWELPAPSVATKV